MNPACVRNQAGLRAFVRASASLCVACFVYGLLVEFLLLA
jgi:hypothetical protein